MALAERGIPSFWCALSKRPLAEHGFRDATTAPERIRETWRPDALLAVPTGRASGIDVIDVDPAGAGWHAEHALKLAPARVHHTRRGHHLLYRHRDGIRNSASKLARGVDVRGEGGYIIWWPAHGCEFVGSLEELTDLPPWLTDALTSESKPKTRAAVGRSANGIVTEPGRNEFLSREAYRLRKRGATVSQIQAVLLAVNEVRCHPPLDAAEVMRIAAGKAAIEPEPQGPVTLEDFYAYMPAHQFIFVPTRELWPASSVNARLRGLDVGKTSPAEWLDQHRPVDQMTWAPGEPLVIQNRLIADGGWIERQGCACFNLYRPPVVALGDANKAGPWVDHVRLVYPDDAEHIIRWLAHRVQRPHEKINHALVMGGGQGIGKDTLLEPVKHAVGPWNFAEVSPPHLLARFNGFVRSVILRVSEARDLGDVDRYAFYDHMKVYTAAPPDVLRCDEKHVREYSVLNVCGVIITSNHKTDGISLPSDDRRHYVAWSALAKEEFGIHYWRDLYAWYAVGGLGHVAAYLTTLDLTGFDAKAPPPATDAWRDIVDANRSPEDADLADVIDALGNPSALALGQLIQRATSDGLRDYLQDRRNRRQIPYRLEAAGYTPVRNPADHRDGHWKVRSKRMVIYARQNLAPRDRIIAAYALCREVDT